MDVAKQVDGTFARPVPGDHRIMAQHEAAAVRVDLDQVMHGRPRQLALDPLVVVVATDQVLLSGQETKDRGGVAASPFCVATGKVANDPEVTVAAIVWAAANSAASISCVHAKGREKKRRIESSPK